MRCGVEGCNKPADFPRIGLCRTCYHYFYYWSKKTPAKIIARDRTLSLWKNRIEIMMKPMKVRTMNRKQV